MACVALMSEFVLDDLLKDVIYHQESSLTFLFYSFSLDMLMPEGMNQLLVSAKF